MGTIEPLHIWIGFDGREAVASDVLAHSIRKRTSSELSINFLKHRELRRAGKFARPWVIDGVSGNFIDMIDGKGFSTEFSHTRFLVPSLMYHKGWALFLDSDMVCLTDIKKLFSLCDDRFAVMCVKHEHKPSGNGKKMDGREQQRYFRKNWSSLVLWNCGHPANEFLTEEKVSMMKGSSLHAFSWLTDDLIGSLPFSYNFISGVSPKLPIERGGRPDVVHYTDGGPWFDECKDVPYSHWWLEEYEAWQKEGSGNKITNIPSKRFEQ